MLRSSVRNVSLFREFCLSWCELIILDRPLGADEMAQQVLAAKSDVLGLIPGTHIVEEENQFPKVVL